MENLELIDWGNLAFASLWILGLSSVLSAIGFADYQAHVKKVRLRQVLRDSNYQRVLNGGMALFCLGMIGSSTRVWEQVIWALLTLAFILFSIPGLAAVDRKEQHRDGAQDG
jgi:hypothetical protein